MPSSADRPRAEEEDRIRGVYASYRASGAASRWSQQNAGYHLLVSQRRSAQREVLLREGMLPLASREILDVGCGHGRELVALTEAGADPARLHGVDLLADRIAEARQQFPDLDFRVGNAEHLDYGDAYFDLVLCFTVFSSILDERMARGVAGEIVRVTKPGGGILWYDLRYSNPRNPNVRGVRQSDLARWFPGFELNIKSIGLLPPLARRLGATTPVSYPLLSLLPPLHSHLIGLLRAPR